MPRLGLLLAALAALGACQPPPDDFSFDQVRAEYRAAMEDGDGGRVIEVLERAADAGEWTSFGELANAYEDGYIRSFPEGSNQPLTVEVPRSLLKSRVNRVRYEAGRKRAIEEGDPYALFQLAGHVLDPSLPMGGLTTGGDPPNPEARDSAAVIYRQIAESDLPRLTVAMLAKAVGDTAAYVRHVDQAVEAGERGACTYKLWLTGDRPDLSTLQGRAAHYDRLLACDPSDEAREHVSEDIRALHEQIALGNAESVVALDSLRRLGLFERHPWLSDLSTPSDA